MKQNPKEINAGTVTYAVVRRSSARRQVTIDHRARTITLGVGVSTADGIVRANREIRAMLGAWYSLSPQQQTAVIHQGGRR